MPGRGSRCDNPAAVDDSEMMHDVDAIADALDGEHPEIALDLAVAAMRRSDEPDPLLHYFAGRALLDLDRPTAALAHLDRAVRIDPDDLDYRTDLAHALFRCCRFEEATATLAPALESAPNRAESHELRALLFEREGRFDEADRHFALASRLDPPRFPVPTRLSPAAFEREVVAAGERLPEPFHRHLAEVAVTVDDVPGLDVLRSSGEAGEPFEPAETLGLFVGVPITERSFDGAGELPPRILLFRRNLERFAAGEGDLREQIAITLYHELGHYLGMEEDDLERVDLA